MAFGLAALMSLYLHIGRASSQPQIGHHSRLSMLGSFERVKSGCAGLHSTGIWSVLGPPGSRGILELKKACFWVKRFQAEADGIDEFLRQQRARQLVEKVRDDLPWFGDSNAHYYPGLPYLLIALFCFIILYLWEHCWLGSTVFAVRFRWRRKTEKKAEKVEPEKHVEKPFSMDQSRFWDVVQEICNKSPPPLSASQGGRFVRFTQRSYQAHVRDGKAIVAVERTGPCDGEVKVQVQTHDRPENNFAAQAGKNYEHTEVELVFPPGKSTVSLEVPLLKTFCWESARWFRVELGPITAGDAELYPQSHTRVFVIDDDPYPGAMPEQRVKNLPHWRISLFLGYHFMKECAAFRGEKFWKTLLAMTYAPFHYVVLETLVQKFIITYVTRRAFLADSYNGAMTEILLFALLQFASVCLLRWADFVQTKNRGRTGGIRQTHRLYLLDKMLITGHQEQMKYKGVQWLYAAIHDVDSVTMDIYWQFFLAVQAAESLLLSFLLLTFWDFAQVKKSGGQWSTARLSPSIIFVIVLPLTIFLTWRRKTKTGNHVTHRKDHEADWMNMFSWLAEVGHQIYGFGYRELASIEALFKQNNKNFVKQHQIARDTMNDSVAIALWLSNISYLIILIWGGFGVLAELDKNDQATIVDVGHYVLLLRLFSRFGKYITKFHNCIVNFQRGSVSLERVRKFLNMKYEAREAPTETESDQQFLPLADIPQDCILLHSACLNVKDKRCGIGPFGSVFTQPGSQIRFPLGRLVFVKSIYEARELSILAMAANVIHADSGWVHCPGYVRRVMLPTQPVHSVGDLTTLGELCTTGASPEQATHLLQALEIDPEHGSRHLAPGQVQVLFLLRALLRDPEVLVLAKPLAFVPDHLRQKALMLLRVWQRCGGAEGLLRLSDTLEPEQKFDLRKQRTVIASFPSVEEYYPSDLVIDLDQYWAEDAEDITGLPEKREFVTI